MSNFEAGQLSQNSVWLRTGRPGDRGPIPGRGKVFSSGLCVQTDSRAYPASCKMVPGVLFLGVKRGQGVMLTTRLT
jgi:hypothetical protein